MPHDKSLPSDEILKSPSKAVVKNHQIDRCKQGVSTRKCRQSKRRGRMITAQTRFDTESLCARFATVRDGAEMDYSPHSEERGKEKEGAEAVCCGEYPDQLYWENVQGNLDQTCTRREGAAEELAALLERLSVANRDPKDAPETTEVDLLCYSEDEDRQDENGSMGKRNTNGVAAGGRFVDKDISTPQGGVKRLRERGQLAEAKIDDTQPKEDADHRAPDESSQLSPA